MEPLTFANTHNMIAFLSKSDASAGFNQIVNFLNAQVIHYTLMVNPTIYVSCIKQFCATASIKKVNDVVKLQTLIDRKKVVITEDIIRQDLRLDDVDGVECLPTEEIFAELARMGYEKPPLKLTFYKVFLSAQWKFLIHTLVQCMSAKRTDWNEFSCSMALAVIFLATVLINNQVDDCSSPTIKYTSPVLTQKVFANMRMIGKGFSGIETPLFATMLVQPQAAAEEEDEEDEVSVTPTPPSLTHTCTTLSHKVVALKQDKVDQALEIFKLKRRVKRLEKKRRSKHSGLKRLRKVGTSHRVESSPETIVGAQEDASKHGRGRIEAIDANEDITLTLIKMKAKKARLLDEQMAKRIHDEEVKQVAVREKQEQDDLKRAQELQQQYDQKQENIDWNVVAEQM
uniref:Synaptobrevin, longin-like domain protein n=1 Tax=Tanacetum cinerariifolium TaxID=118510 RepID=A0A6L2N8B1_TANCI|nr:hypothetical protein [Tanacetum cinerariifolium]